MNRFTIKSNDKVHLKSNSLNGEFFQNLIERLAEYEDLEEKGLISRQENIQTSQERKTDINCKYIIDIILDKIISIAQEDTDFDIKTVLPAYCKEKNLKSDYDGLFWSNEGYNWKYKNVLYVVKLVDTYFVIYRKLYYPHLKHRNYNMFFDDQLSELTYPCRYDYLISKEK